MEEIEAHGGVEDEEFVEPAGIQTNVIVDDLSVTLGE